MKKAARIFICDNYILLLIFLAPFIFLFLHSPQFFLTHDGPFHLERTFNYIQSLREGNFPPSWTHFYNSGFGSPIFIFLFPIPYLVTVFLNILGVNLLSSVRIGFIFFQFIAGLSMFLWLKSGLKLRKEAALVGSLFYLYAPYSLVQVFVRGSLREFAGSSIFPLVLFVLTKLAQNPNRKLIALSSITFGLFLLSDGLSVLLFSLFLLSYLFYLFFKAKNKQQLVVSFLITFLLGLAIAAYVYLPFIFESQFLRGTAGNDYFDHFIYFQQYFNLHWGFGFSLPGPNDGMSFQIGVANLLAILITVFLFVKKKISDKLLFFILGFNLIIYSILMTHSSLAKFIWEKISVLRLLEFPWRFLAPTVLVTSVLAALGAESLRFNSKKLLAITIFIFLISFRYLRTNQPVVFNPSYLTKNTGDATAYHEFIPKWRDSTSQFEGFPNKIETIKGKLETNNLLVKDTTISFQTTATVAGTLRVNTLYFPGWKAYSEKEEINVKITDNKDKPSGEKRDISGLMEINIPTGDHSIKLIFSDTPVRQLGKIISLLGFGLGLVLLI